MKAVSHISALFVAMFMMALPLGGQARPAPRKEKAPAKVTVASAVESVALGFGAEYDAARAFLAENKDGFAPRAAAMASVISRYPNDADAARRLLDMAIEAGDEGCRFASTLIAPKYPAWMNDVLKRYPAGIRCEAMDRVIAAIPSWAPDPASSRDAELFALDVIEALKAAGSVDGAMAACTFVNRGPSNVRIAAADLIAAVRPEKGLNCLVKAFDREKNSENRTLAGEYLDAIARFGGDSAYPHLLNAFENVNHFDKACSVVVRSGDPGLKTLVRAVRAVSGRSPLLMECLSRHAVVARPYILPLLKDKSRDMKKFALAFFSRNHFPEALEQFKEGFRRNDNTVAPEIPRDELFEAMATYPVEDISDMVLLALTDNDDRIRDHGLELIRDRKSLAFAAAVRTVAETDPNRVSRTYALGILWFLADFGAEPLVRRMAQYEESSIATEAAKILGFIGSQDSIDTLRKLAGAYRGQPRGFMALRSLAMLGITVDPMKASFVGLAEPRLKKIGGHVTCGRFEAVSVGQHGPLLLALPGGPGMDSLWARPWLEELSSKAVVAFVEPIDRATTSDVVLTAQDFDCFVEAYGHDRAVLISDGIGGTSAQWLAFQAPARTAGVITISSPIPGHAGAFDEALIRGLPQPFDEISRDLIAHADQFRPEALDYYLLKAASPSLSGDMDNVRDVMRMRWNSQRLAAARQELSRSEVRFQAMEVDRPVMWILPVERMTAEEIAPYREMVAQRPGRFRIAEVGASCGLLPEVSCDGRLEKLVRQFLKDL